MHTNTAEIVAYRLPNLRSAWVKCLLPAAASSSSFDLVVMCSSSLVCLVHPCYLQKPLGINHYRSVRYFSVSADALPPSLYQFSSSECHSLLSSCPRRRHPYRFRSSSIVLFSRFYLCSYLLSWASLTKSFVHLSVNPLSVCITQNRHRNNNNYYYYSHISMAP